MTDQPTPDTATDRRSFLKVAGLGTLGSGAALVASKTAEAAPDRQETGYRETEHVKTYYDLARF